VLVHRIEAYQPLIVMVAIIFVGSLVLSWSLSVHWMPIFMGLFLLNFAMFKLFDLGNFAKSFAMYDSIGKRSGLYARAYPFIELTLAIGFLSCRYLDIVNAATAIIMAIGLIGILQNRKSGAMTRCACMGSLIDVPVGSITILENVSMIVMAIWCFFTL
jgi:hypothetical protein